MNLAFLTGNAPTPGTHYLTGDVQVTTRKRGALKAITLTAVTVIMLIGLITQAITGGANNPLPNNQRTTAGTTALADDESDAKKEIKGLSDSYIQKDEDGKPSLFNTINKADGEDSPNDFGYIMRRLFSTGYINHAGDATNDGRQDNCYVSQSGTPYYHNCDVPNFMTEALQSFMDPFITTGPQNAEIRKAKGGLLWVFDGIPDSETLPDAGPAVDENARSAKYTGLEIFGYNLNYTTYLGEWDNIKVMTAARSLSNFGFMDSLKLGATAVIKGVANGVGNAASGFVNRISTGNILGAVGGLWSDFVGGSSAAVVKVVMDTSDQNVFNNWAWYRVGYGSTLYNARELTAEETAAQAKRALYNMILGSQPDAATAPQELKDLKKPAAPADETSKCVIRVNGKNTEQKNASDNGITEGDCKLQANTAAPDGKAHKVNTPNDLKKDGDYAWKKDGTSKRQTLKEWVAANQATFNTAKKYGMSINTDGDESKRDEVAQKILSEWDSEYSKALQNSTAKEAEAKNSEWVNQLLGTAAFAAHILSNPSQSYNAPWSRFACTNADGTDMHEDNGTLVMLMDSDGNMNPKCSGVRPPIQDGLFGNGYTGDAKNQVGTDTRRARLNTNVLANLIPIDSAFDSVAAFWLGVATTSTMVSNEVMSWAFSPLLSQLGITDIVVNTIKFMRDSIFFPLAAIMVAFGAFMALWNLARKGNAKETLITLCLIIATFATGVALLQSPGRTVKAIDTIPSMVEQTIVGYIFSANNEPVDQLCTASGTVSTKAGTGLENEQLPFTPSEGTRSLMCENWRTFAFNPWVYGQWGTGYHNLYANGSGKDGAWDNKNSSIVGDAAVPLGNNISEKNWGLYQLRATTSGTAYYTDQSNPTGRIDRDFYRIVDAQAGPSNAANSYPRYFNTWSGTNLAPRAGTAMLGGIIGVLGAYTVIVYSVTKVQVTFIVTMLLLIMPLMLLMGILPYFGTGKLRRYFGTIGGLMVQRVFIALFLAVMFRILAGVGTASSSYPNLALFTAAICVFFLMIRKEVEEMIFRSVASKFGGSMADAFRRDPSGFIRGQIGRGGQGGFISNKAEIAKSTVVGAAAGATAAKLTGGSGLRAALDSVRTNTTNLRNQQRRRGYRTLDTLSRGAQAGKQAGRRQLADDQYAADIKREAYRDTKVWKDYESAARAYDALPTKEERNIRTGKMETFKYDPATGKRMEKPEAPTFESASKDLNITIPGRKLKKLADRRRKADDLEMGGKPGRRSAPVKNRAKDTEALVHRTEKRVEDASDPSKVAERRRKDARKDKHRERIDGTKGVRKITREFDKKYQSSKNEEYRVRMRTSLHELMDAAAAYDPEKDQDNTGLPDYMDPVEGDIYGPELPSYHEKGEEEEE